MPNADYQLRYAALGMTGSFWARQITPEAREQARVVTSLMANSGGLQRMDEPINQLLSQRRVLVENLVVPYLEGDVAFVGPDLFDYFRGVLGLEEGATIRLAKLTDRTIVDPGPGTPNGLFVASVGDESDFPGTEPLHLVPMPEGLVPLVIGTRVKDVVLVSGIDFEAREGFIVMREAPGRLFTAGGIVVLTGSKELPAPYNYTNHVDGRPYGNRFTSFYQRTSQSKTSFECAAAEAAGMLVLPVTDTVVLADAIDGGTRYVFAILGVIDILYPHAPLTPGASYQAGHIVTDRFAIMARDGADYGWVSRATADSGSYSLDGVLPTKGLTLPVGQVYADWTEQTGGKPHLRLHLTGSGGALDAFWLAQKEHELRTGNYLSDALGVTTEDAARFVDFASLLASYYGDMLLVVRLGMDYADPAYKDRLLRFLQREKPIGSVMLISD